MSASEGRRDADRRGRHRRPRSRHWRPALLATTVGAGLLAATAFTTTQPAATAAVATSVTLDSTAASADLTMRVLPRASRSTPRATIQQPEQDAVPKPTVLIRPAPVAKPLQIHRIPKPAPAPAPAARPQAPKPTPAATPTPAPTQTAEATEKPAAAPAADGISGAPCASGSAVEQGIDNNAVKVHRAVCALFPSVSGYGGRTGSGGEHGSGHALDIMIPSHSVGQAIADYVRANAGALGVSQVIWSQHIWTVQRSGEGWRSMSDRGSATANHYDHVHVTVY